MRLSSVLTLATGVAAASLGERRLAARQSAPLFPTEPGTAAHCNSWWDNEGFLPCDSVLSIFSLTIDDFVKWNPTITSECGNFNTGFSYCVGTSSQEPEPVTSAAVTSSVRTTTVPPAVTTTPQITIKTTTTTTTKPGNGIETPEPIQEGMIKTCNKFHLVKTTTTCASIMEYYSLTWADVFKWNPAIGKNCESLWSNTYACVGVIGGSSPPPAATTTSAGNGIATPTPIQDGMTKSCNKFHLVKTTTTCDSILNYYSLTWANLYSWNPAIGKNCESLWSNTYACVGVIGGTASPTTTAPAGNGIATPSPIQDGMTKSCKQFHLIKSTTTCDSILNYYSLSWANFYSWNPAVGKDCLNLWTGTYACVAASGGSSTPTTTAPAGNGVATPTPIQDGMTKKCNKFHLVKTTTTCDSILDYYKLTWNNFFSWNPAVGSDCRSLWANTYACVGIM